MEMIKGFCLFSVFFITFGLNGAEFKEAIKGENEKIHSLESGGTNSALDSFGVRHDINSGQVYLSHTDVDIPGNSKLPVRFTRIRSELEPSRNSGNQMRDWDVDVPVIMMRTVTSRENSYSGNYKYAERWYVYPDNACSENFPIGYNAEEYLGMYRAIKWPTLRVNGISKPLYKIEEGTAPFPADTKFVTKDNWVSKCIFDENNPNKNIGFLVQSPNGDKYTFDVRWRDKDHPYTRYYASKVEDSFGNWVKYEFNNGILKRIESNDGRVITIASSRKGGVYPYIFSDFSGFNIFSIDSITANDKTWSYGYESKKIIISGSLGRVSWSVSDFLNYLTSAKDPEGLTYSYLPSEELVDDTKRIKDTVPFYEVTNPLGAKLRMDFSKYDMCNGVFVELGVMLEFSDCIYNFSGSYSDFDFNLGKKNIPFLSKVKISVSENQSYDWSYKITDGLVNSENAPSRWNWSKSNWWQGPEFRVIKTTSPSGIYQNKYNQRQGKSYGELVESKVYYGNSWSVVSTFVYDDQGMAGNHCPFSEKRCDQIYVVSGNDLDVEKTFRQLSEVKQEQDSVSYSQKFTYDSYHNLSVKEESTSEDESVRYSQYTYHYDPLNWYVGRLKNISISSDNISWSKIYNLNFNDLNLPEEQFSYGKKVMAYSYHPDGNVKKITYTGSNNYVLFDDYFRGEPKKVTMPCSIANACNKVNGSTVNTIVASKEINWDGTIKAEKDFNGNSTAFSYNSIGWLTGVEYSDPKVTKQVITFDKVTNADDGVLGSGIVLGQLRKVITRGNYEQRSYFDGLFRREFTSVKDKSSENSVVYKMFEYDSDNRIVLESFPSAIASNNLGVFTEFDSLGRTESITRTTDNAKLTHEYLAMNQVVVKDPEGNNVTTKYLSYGKPSYDKPILIQANDAEDTVISYSLFDQVDTITQGNITEKRYYDSQNKLCKQVRPETGQTAFKYNSQNQLVWRAEATAGDLNACDADSVLESHKTRLNYDNLGQLRTEVFPDNTPSKTYSYDANGNLIFLQAGSVSWNYLYDSQNRLKNEILSLDGKSFELDWTYDGLGSASSLKYPSGIIIDYAPNALGQPTKAGSYASNVSYHANGQIKQFTYGNGIVRNVTLDSTGRMDLLKDSKSGVLKTSLAPSYDYNDNLASLIDGVDTANNISNLAYDGLDRLKSADGRWGKGSYSYDGLGNITSRSISGAAINYSYDNLNRLNKLNGAYGYSYQYDSRGNVSHNGRYGLTFNRANQVSEAKGIPYVYDGHNRRVKQTKPEGSHYSVYSSAGQLLHRKVEHGSHTDSVYLGKQLIAEVENGDSSLVTSDPSVAKPSINFNITQYTVGSSCPPKMVCATNGITYHNIRWTTENATSCTGNVVRNPDAFPLGSISISGTASKLSYPANGTVYTINLTCVGAGGQSTAQRILSGVGLPNEM
ncbi:YD repeat [Shewanella denitrificans OS217]|uniref:YD repeat n=1 Tax=Shewanella denitrificans (strain OS217 / ATCC BAA-1090 / DSM 15013) TaxID=318161 RepID=Q12SZ7_SHEDO|nr:RHS repeat protein [Shewanella denitrificans]ABE53429.1 YD repeat [Shewanella denitrificans OS217]